MKSDTKLAQIQPSRRTKTPTENTSITQDISQAIQNEQDQEEIIPIVNIAKHHLPLCPSGLQGSVAS